MALTSKDSLHDVGLVIAAAGASTRFGKNANKLLLPLRGQPLFLHVLTRFLAVVPPANTVLVVPRHDETLFRQALEHAGVSHALRIAYGAETRQQSVIAGLHALPDELDIVAVQDAARPLTTVDALLACVEAARTHGTGIAARPLTDTVKVVDDHTFVTRTVPRDRLWATETPQAVNADLLRHAYAHVMEIGAGVTDEAQAVEEYGRPVKLVRIRTANPKVTYAPDIRLVEALLETG
jgi:2-C-methyl-D-erythritol 4-phosphate cytidylyltransferase